MGNCTSAAAIRRQEKQLERTSNFVRYAMLGDLLNLRSMLAKDKMDPNARDRFGMTALHWACYTGKLACIQELLLAGASTLVVDENGRNALHHACRKDQDDVVRFLVQDQKMDINSVSENKDTPLHKAVRGKGVKSIEVLLQNGANPHLCNDQNRTPLEELDSNPGTITNVVQGEVTTARVNEELEALRNDFLTDPTHRHHSKPSKPRAKSLASRFYGDNESRRGDTTLITRFGASIREFSERQSSDCSLSARTSSSPSLAGGVWARVTGANSSSPALSSARIDASSSFVEFAPLNLTMLDAALSSPPSPHTLSTSSSHSTRTTPQSATHRANSESLAQPRRKNLKYAGKRVIMALRVKHRMPVDEKQEMIRLLLLKHMQRGGAGDVTASGGAAAKSADQVPADEIESGRSSTALPPRLQHQLSGLTLSISADS